MNAARDVAGRAGRTSDRAAWGSITREVVVEAATELVSGEGSPELSIRSLAARLNVSPMAIYRHVDNKEDLLDEVVNRLLARRWRPHASKQDWQAWITEAADRLRRFLVAQPAALQVYLRRPVTSPTALQRMDACLEVLGLALGDEGEALSAYAAIQTYTIGFAALEAARESSPATADDGAPPAARELAAYTSPAQFRAGLDYLLRGIASG